MRTSLRALGWTAIVATLFAAVALASAAWSQDAALVGVDEVVSEPLDQQVPVIGRFVARQGGPVATQISGLVTGLDAHVGDRVEAGDKLAALDLDRLRWRRDLAKAGLDAATARLGAARARLAKKQQETARIEGIRESAAFSRARYEDLQQEVIEAEESVAEAVAAVASAEAELRLRQHDLENGVVRAPYPGVVTGRHTEVGAYLGAGERVVSLVNIEELEIETDVPYARIAALEAGRALDIRLPDGTNHQGVVRAVGAEEDPLTRTRILRLTPVVENPVVPIAAGMSATVFVPAGIPREVVTVHKDAVLKREGISLVYVVEDGAAQVRPVELGEAVGDRFEVRSGLEAGEIVVTRGNERLRPGQPVTTGEG